MPPLKGTECTSHQAVGQPCASPSARRTFPGRSSGSFLMRLAVMTKKVWWRGPLWAPGSQVLARLHAPQSGWLSTPRIPYPSPLASVYGRPPGLSVFEGWFNLASGRLFKNDEDRNFTAGLFVGHVTILTCLGRERPGQASLGTVDSNLLR